MSFVENGICQVDASYEGNAYMNKMGKSQKIALLVSVCVAGGGGAGLSTGIAAATNLSPVLTGLLAGLLSTLLGTITLIVMLRGVGE